MMSKTAVSLLLVIVGIAACFSVVSGQGSSCISSFSSSEDYFPFGYNASDPFAIPLGQAVVETAEDFAVQYNKSYKIAFSNHSQATYALYQCGAPVPTGLNTSIPPIQIPLSSVAIDSTIIIPYFELLGLLPLLKAVDNDVLAYASSPCLRKLVASNITATYNLSDGSFVGTIISGNDVKRAMIPVTNVQFDAAFDPGTLKRAEWLKYLAVFFNVEMKATAVYDQIVANYKCLNGSNNLTSIPTVAWVSVGLYGPGQVTVDGAAYKTQFVSDAGGKNLASSAFRNYNISNTTDLSALKSLLQTIDILIDESYASIPSTYYLANFTSSLGVAANSSYPFMTTKNVWRVDRRTRDEIGGLDWYEGLFAQPQIALQELLAIVNPTVVRLPYFFRNVAMGDEIVSLTTELCTTDPSAALAPTIYNCPIKLSDSLSPPPSTSTSTSPPPAPSSAYQLQAPLVGGLLVGLAIAMML